MILKIDQQNNKLYNLPTAGIDPSLMVLAAAALSE